MSERMCSECGRKVGHTFNEEVIEHLFDTKFACEPCGFKTNCVLEFREHLKSKHGVKKG